MGLVDRVRERLIRRAADADPAPGAGEPTPAPAPTSPSSAPPAWMTSRPMPSIIPRSATGADTSGLHRDLTVKRQRLTLEPLTHEVDASAGGRVDGLVARSPEPGTPRSGVVSRPFAASRAPRSAAPQPASDGFGDEHGRDERGDEAATTADAHPTDDGSETHVPVLRATTPANRPAPGGVHRSSPAPTVPLRSRPAPAIESISRSDEAPEASRRPDTAAPSSPLPPVDRVATAPAAEDATNPSPANEHDAAGPTPVADERSDASTPTAADGAMAESDAAVASTVAPIAPDGTPTPSITDAGPRPLVDPGATAPTPLQRSVAPDTARTTVGRRPLVTPASPDAPGGGSERSGIVDRRVATDAVQPAPATSVLRRASASTAPDRPSLPIARPIARPAALEGGPSTIAPTGPSPTPTEAADPVALDGEPRPDLPEPDEGDAPTAFGAIDPAFSPDAGPGDAFDPAGRIGGERPAPAAPRSERSPTAATTERATAPVAGAPRATPVLRSESERPRPTIDPPAAPPRPGLGMPLSVEEVRSRSSAQRIDHGPGDAQPDVAVHRRPGPAPRARVDPPSAGLRPPLEATDTNATTTTGETDGPAAADGLDLLLQRVAAPVHDAAARPTTELPAIRIDRSETVSRSVDPDAADDRDVLSEELYARIERRLRRDLLQEVERRGQLSRWG